PFAAASSVSAARRRTASAARSRRADAKPLRSRSIAAMVSLCFARDVASVARRLQRVAAPIAAEWPLQRRVGDDGRMRIVPTRALRGLGPLQLVESEVAAVVDADLDPVDVLPAVAVLAIADPFVEAEARLGHVLFDDEEVLVDGGRRDRETDVGDVASEMAAQHRHDRLGRIHLGTRGRWARATR